jgi:hypothetical protein
MAYIILMKIFKGFNNLKNDLFDFLNKKYKYFLAFDLNLTQVRKS